MDTDKEIRGRGSGIYHMYTSYGLLNRYLPKELKATTRNLKQIGRRSFRNTGSLPAVNSSEGTGDEDKLKKKFWAVYTC